MAKITYEDKVALNVNSDIADVNKCNATDLNEIKNVVNENDDNTTNNSNAIGDLSSLNTTNKNNLVSAINEVNTILGTIIESGTNSNGTYIKYSNGIMMCTKRVQFSTPFNVAWGSLYETPNPIPVGSFAMPFIETPILSVASSIGSSVMFESPSGFTKTGIQGIILTRPVKSDSATGGSFDIIAIGKWK